MMPSTSILPTLAALFAFAAPAQGPDFLPFPNGPEWGAQRDNVGGIDLDPINDSCYHATPRGGIIGAVDKESTLTGGDADSEIFSGRTSTDNTGPATLTADQLLQEIRHEAFWFGVGDPSAPTIYTLINPECGLCSEAVTALGNAIADGDAQLRVALAPARTELSLDLSAAILSSSEPPIAFMEHEYAWAEGYTGLRPAWWVNLPKRVRDGVGRNSEIMGEFGHPSMPFFAFDTKDGPRIWREALTPEAIASAIRDPHSGIGR